MQTQNQSIVQPLGQLEQLQQEVQQLKQQHQQLHQQSIDSLDQSNIQNQEMANKQIEELQKTVEMQSKLIQSIEETRSEMIQQQETNKSAAESLEKSVVSLQALARGFVSRRKSQDMINANKAALQEEYQQAKSDNSTMPTTTFAVSSDTASRSTKSL